MLSEWFEIKALLDNFTKNSTIWADKSLISAVQSCIDSQVSNDRDNLLEFLDLHGITLMVHEWSLQGLIQLSELQQKPVAESARVYTAQWLMQQQAFVDLSRQFDEASIDWILLKGEALGRWLYPASRLRMRGDVDVLVRRDHRDRAMALLERCGYFRTLSTGADLVFSEQQYGRTLSSSCHLAVDLHWSVSNRKVYAASLNEQTLFDAAAAAQTAHCLPPELAMIHAVIHRVSHHHEDIRMIWWIDLWLIWQQFDSTQQSQCLKLFSEHGLAEALLHEADAMLCWFDPLIDADQRQQLVQAVAAGDQIAVEVGGWQALKQDLSVQSWPDRLAFLLELMLPPARYMIQRYRIRHRITLPWFYLRRLLNGFWNLIRGPKPNVNH